VSTSHVGKILTLFISKNMSPKRATQAEIALDEKGILSDKFYDKGIQRSVLITSIDSYDLALEHGIKMPYGSLGENILMNYNPYALPTGSKLRIGEVILQISQNCTICNHLSHIDKKLPKLLKHDRGIFAQVVKGGVIKSDDSIYLL